MARVGAQGGRMVMVTGGRKVRCERPYDRADRELFDAGMRIAELMLRRLQGDTGEAPEVIR